MNSDIERARIRCLTSEENCCTQNKMAAREANDQMVVHEMFFIKFLSVQVCGIQIIISLGITLQFVSWIV